MKVKTLPAIVSAIKKMGIVPGSFPDNVCLTVELDEHEFDEFLDQAFLGKTIIAKKTAKIKGYVNSEITGIKIKIEQK